MIKTKDDPKNGINENYILRLVKVKNESIKIQNSFIVIPSFFTLSGEFRAWTGTIIVCG